MCEYFDMSLKEQFEKLMKMSGRDVILTEENASFLNKFVGRAAYFVTYKCFLHFGEITTEGLKSTVSGFFTDSIDQHMILEGEKIVKMNENKPERVIGVVVDIPRLIKENGFPWYGIKEENTVLMFIGMIQFVIEDILDRGDDSTPIETIEKDKGYNEVSRKLSMFYRQ